MISTIWILICRETFRIIEDLQVTLNKKKGFSPVHADDYRDIRTG
jgi:hypothetical protein